jgi:ribosomal protein S18 acetylase RimI-like enzyme
MQSRSTPINIRQATPDDAELISSLNVDVQAIHAAALPERFKRPGPASFTAAETRGLLAKADNLVFLAFTHSAPAGYTYAEIIRRPETSLTYAYQMIHVHHISVKPEHRRRGVGSALLDAVRLSASSLDIAQLTVDVWSFNDAARTFFHRHGFEHYIERFWLNADPAVSDRRVRELE